MLKEKIKKIIEEFDMYYIFIILLTIIICSPLISNKSFLGHDSLYHISNIEDITIMFKTHNFSKISPIIAASLGYGGSIFYPKLPHIIGAFINLFLNNAPSALKLSNILTVYTSAFFMYRLLNNLFENKKASLLGSVLYITMPYFISDIFIRGAFNESLIFIFMPMILNGIISLIKNKPKSFYINFVIGYLGILNSHLVLSVYFTILLIIFMLINIKKILTKQNIKALILASIIILVLILPSIILMLEHKSLNIYGVFDPNIMGSKFEYVKSNGLSLLDYVKPIKNSYNGIVFFINIIIIILCIFGLANLIKNKNNNEKKGVIIGVIIFSILSIFLSSKYFPYNLIPKLLLSIQFAFRCLSFVSLGLCILSSYGLLFFSEKNQKYILSICILLTSLIILPFINSVNFFNTDLINSWDKYSGMGYQKEYLTNNAKNTLDYFDKRDNTIIINNGDAKIEILKNETPYLEFKVDNITSPTELELPRLYYLGYNIELENEKGIKEKLDYNYDKYGFITITINENGIVKVNYKGTKLYNIFLLLRITFIIGLLIFILTRKLFELKNKSLRTAVSN